MTYFKHLIDIFFPSLCLNCNIRLQKNEVFLCETCERNLIFLKSICPVCGAPLKDTDQECLFCKDRDFSFDLARSLFLFADIQNLIHHFKYRQFSRLGKYLAVLMYRYLEENQVFNQIDLVIPIPLHRVKKRERGYNQSAEIARHLALKKNWEYAPNAVYRKRFTGSQTRLSREERRQNVDNAFGIKNNLNLENRSILLIDDVFTTGATVDSISNLLKNNNVRAIYVLTIGRA